MATGQTNQTQFDLNVNTESQSQKPMRAESSQEIAAKISELMQQQGIDSEANPMAAEKIQRDLEYQRQMETFAQPDSAPLPQPTTTPGLDRLEELQRQLDERNKEVATWKTRWGQKTGEVGVMKRQLAELESKVSQMQPAISVQQITGREPNDPLTAQDAVNLLMSQSTAFGNVIRQLREEIRESKSLEQTDGLPLDMESELVEAHPWLSELPRPQKLRAMQDILASAGVTVTPPAPANTQAPQRQTSSLPESAKTQIRQAPYIEPSNRGSRMEQSAISPERQAYNDKIAKYKEALSKPGGSEEAARILASLGAGPIDETQIGYMQNRR